MTKIQRLQLFGAMCRYQLALLELPDNSQLDMKPYFEPLINEWLAEAREEGRRLQRAALARNERPPSTADVFFYSLKSR
jgi:hypothetical protein